MTSTRLAAVLVLALGCAGAKRSTPRIVPTPPPVVDAGTDAPPVDPLPTLDALATTAVPGMREAMRISDATRPVTVTADMDTCFRAVVAATSPVRASFEDESRSARGAELSGATGLVPPAGPACARKGESLRLIVTGADAARAIVWRTD